MLASNSFDDLMFVLAFSWCKFECEEPSYVSGPMTQIFWPLFTQLRETSVSGWFLVFDYVFSLDTTFNLGSDVSTRSSLPSPLTNLD